LIGNILLFVACAKRVQAPVYDEPNVKAFLSLNDSIKAIETRFSLRLENGDTQIGGDGILKITSRGDLYMRIYSFGFLAFEIISENGLIRSNPMIDRYKEVIFTQGLRDCLFWWNIIDFEIEEKKDIFILKNRTRTVWLDRKTLMPKKQTVSLYNGSVFNIVYKNPEQFGNIWYPSDMKIEALDYSVTLKVKDMLFIFNV
jgi:hypothetical protein